MTSACIVAFLIAIFSGQILCTLLLQKYNMGTALFSNKERKVRCWSRDRLATLKARRHFQALVPNMMTLFYEDNFGLLAFLNYVNSTYAIIQKTYSDRELNRILNQAFSDVVGGFLKLFVLPSVKIMFYYGSVDYSETVSIQDWYNKILRELKTDGAGWHNFVLDPPYMALATALRRSSIYSRSLKHCNFQQSPCELFVYSEVTPKGLTIPMPKINWKDKTIFLPVINETNFSLFSGKHFRSLRRYYENARCCVNSKGDDVEKFERKFENWLISQMLFAALLSEPVYPPLGDLLPVVDYTHMGDVVDLSSYNAMYLSTSTKKANPLKKLIPHKNSTKKLTICKHLSKEQICKHKSSFMSSFYDIINFIVNMVMVFILLLLLILCYNYKETLCNCCKWFKKQKFHRAFRNTENNPKEVRLKRIPEVKPKCKYKSCDCCRDVECDLNCHYSKDSISQPASQPGRQIKTDFSNETMYLKSKLFEGIFPPMCNTISKLLVLSEGPANVNEPRSGYNNNTQRATEAKDVYKEPILPCKEDIGHDSKFKVVQTTQTFVTLPGCKKLGIPIPIKAAAINENASKQERRNDIQNTSNLERVIIKNKNDVLRKLQMEKDVSVLKTCLRKPKKYMTQTENNSECLPQNRITKKEHFISKLPKKAELKKPSIITIFPQKIPRFSTVKETKIRTSQEKSSKKVNGPQQENSKQKICTPQHLKKPSKIARLIKQPVATDNPYTTTTLQEKTKDPFTEKNTHNVEQMATHLETQTKLESYDAKEISVMKSFDVTKQHLFQKKIYGMSKTNYSRIIKDKYDKCKNKLKLDTMPKCHAEDKIPLFQNDDKKVSKKKSCSVRAFGDSEVNLITQSRERTSRINVSL